MELTQAITSRRTHKIFDGTMVSKDVLLELLSLAMDAPNHRKNEPWFFRVIEREQIPRFWKKLSDRYAEIFPGDDAPTLLSKKGAMEQKVLNLGAVIYVTCLKNENPVMERENYAACSCAIQNMLLAATARNLGSFWNTGTVFSCKAATELIGMDEGKEFFVGAIWLGHTDQKPTAPQYKKEAKISFWHSP